MQNAGRMNAAPAVRRPGSPARARPMWIASSVEFGPGIRFVAPTKSRNWSRVNQRRRRTTSISIRAMWAAGPPKPMAPSLRKTRLSSRSLVPRELSSIRAALRARGCP